MENRLLTHWWCRHGYCFITRTRPAGGSHGTARQKRNARRWLYEEAYAEYGKIAAQFPKEVTAYSAMIDIAVVNLQDRKRAEVIYKNALAVLTDERHREKITREYGEILLSQKGNPGE